MDDFLGGASSLTQLMEIKEQLSAVLQLGGLQLDKWPSNHPGIRCDSQIKEVFDKESAITQSLRVIWNQTNDALTFSANKCKENPYKCKELNE